MNEPVEILKGANVRVTSKTVSIGNASYDVASLETLEIVETTTKLDTGKTVALVALVISAGGFLIFGMMALLIGGILALVSVFLNSTVKAFSLVHVNGDDRTELYVNRDVEQVKKLGTAIAHARTLATKT